MNYELDELGLNTFLEEFIEKLGIETKSLQKDLELIKKIDDVCSVPCEPFTGGWMNLICFVFLAMWNVIDWNWRTGIRFISRSGEEDHICMLRWLKAKWMLPSSLSNDYSFFYM